MFYENDFKKRGEAAYKFDCAFATTRIVFMHDRLFVGNVIFGQFAVRFLRLFDEFERQNLHCVAEHEFFLLSRIHRCAVRPGKNIVNRHNIVQKIHCKRTSARSHHEPSAFFGEFFNRKDIFFAYAAERRARGRNAFGFARGKSAVEIAADNNVG